MKVSHYTNQSPRFASHWGSKGTQFDCIETPERTKKELINRLYIFLNWKFPRPGFEPDFRICTAKSCPIWPPRGIENLYSKMNQHPRRAVFRWKCPVENIIRLLQSQYYDLTRMLQHFDSFSTTESDIFPNTLFYRIGITRYVVNNRNFNLRLIISNPEIAHILILIEVRHVSHVSHHILDPPFCTQYFWLWIHDQRPR